MQVVPLLHAPLELLVLMVNVFSMIVLKSRIRNIKKTVPLLLASSEILVSTENVFQIILPASLKFVKIMSSVIMDNVLISVPQLNVHQASNAKRDNASR